MYAKKWMKVLELQHASHQPPEHAPEKAMFKQLTGTDEAAGRRCLSGLQVLNKQLTGADQLADRC